MPIYEFGYRHWTGRLRHRLWRWWPITRAGVALCLRGKLLRRSLFMAWTPLFYFGPLFFAVGSLTESREQSNQLWQGMIEGTLGRDVAFRISQDPTAMRPAAWSLAFFYFLGHTQTILLLLVVSNVGPPLISQDVRSKSFLMYFSKSLTRFDYILGKSAVLLGFIGFVTLLPALTLYAVSIGFSPSFSAIFATSITVLRIVAASLVVGIPACLTMLFVSSLSGDSRVATFTWVAACVFGELFYQVLSVTPALRGSSWVFLFSARQTALAAMGGIFDVSGQLERLQLQQLAAALGQSHSPGLAFLSLGTMSVLCLVGLFQRISAPMKI